MGYESIYDAGDDGVMQGKTGEFGIFHCNLFFFAS